MSYPKDLARPYDDLPNIRHQGWLHKRSGSFPHSFRKRYCVVACNFLFLYTDTSDDKPHKAIWIESVHTEGVDPRKKHEFCFTVKTDNFEGIFAAETEAEKQEVRTCHFPKVNRYGPLRTGLSAVDETHPRSSLWSSLLGTLLLQLLFEYASIYTLLHS
eukprot:gb/GECG01013443.1/.p1 GENE.gb/GECG01013443.1/~~gb/GECG01013443.1/.p1  ORF type:complete len:159 (+),score=12.25 gb/GECG01013443.1/:1-477(+)